MQSTHYGSGEEDALLHLSLEKTAVLGALASRLGGVAMSGLRGLGGGFSGIVRAGTRAALPFTQAAESGLARGVGSVFGQRAGNVAQRLLRGTGSAVVSNAIGQGIVGGALEGTLGALTAEKGDRANAFLRGASRGALSGAAIGGVTGGLGHLVNRGALMGLNRYAAGRGISQSAVSDVMNKGFFGNARDLLRGTTGPLGRRGALAGLSTAATGFGATTLLPAMGMGGLNSPPPPPNPYQDQFNQQQNNFLTRTGADDTGSPVKKQRDLYIGTYPLTMMAGTALGKATSDIGADLLERAGYLPQGTLRKILVSRLANIPGALTGALAGHYVGTKLTEDSA